MEFLLPLAFFIHMIVIWEVGNQFALMIITVSHSHTITVWALPCQLPIHKVNEKDSREVHNVA